MTSKLDRVSAFKKVTGGSKLSPGYLYDIDLLIKAENWLKQDARSNRLVNPASTQD